ncbi:hypothetical protein CISG_05631 [Coccidioides immitis RMSCC 3703]|uniref:Major facilitator superfamily (MFS) profile domain-containing protein n=1 Tax=Coccidioides immitis RMSCC 3703 TaxID=454286 RepID=A0A0J8QZH8_COCIT|nr:hypothetical protein CISG_05631 [Coccidioides immitis RMSCC 3703]
MAVFAIAPLFGAAAADYGGRKTVYMFALGSFLIANILSCIPPGDRGGTVRAPDISGVRLVYLSPLPRMCSSVLPGYLLPPRNPAMPGRKW